VTKYVVWLWRCLLSSIFSTSRLFNGFAWCHVCVFLVYRSPSFGDASHNACGGGNSFVVGGFSCWEVFVVDICLPCLMDVCVVVVIGLGSFLCSWDAGSVSVVARVDRAMSSLGWGRGLSPLCSFACIVVALSIRSCVCPDDVVRDSSILVQSLTPSSHRGGKCFKSMSAYLRVWYLVRRSLA
jgi:hypothetical protein